MVFASLTFLPAAAHSETKRNDPKKAEAARLKSAADSLMDQDRYADALVLYQQAYDLSRDPALLYNQGRAFEALGDYPTAVVTLERFEREASPATLAKVRGLREHLADLRSRTATLIVRTEAPNARLLVRSKDEGVISHEKRVVLRAGTAAVEITADGYETFLRTVDLSAGATVVLDARLVSKTRDALIFVRSKPSASISLDGEPVGRTPLDLRTSPGAHELLAEAPGHVDEKIPLVLAASERRTLNLDMRPTPAITSRWWFWAGLTGLVAGGVATAIALTTERPPSAGSLGTVAGP